MASPSNVLMLLATGVVPRYDFAFLSLGGIPATHGERGQKLRKGIVACNAVFAFVYGFVSQRPQVHSIRHVAHNLAGGCVHDSTLSQCESTSGFMAWH